MTRASIEEHVFVARPPGAAPLAVLKDGHTLLVRDAQARETSRWHLAPLDARNDALALAPAGASRQAAPPLPDLLAALETVFALQPVLAHVQLDVPAHWWSGLRGSGLTLPRAPQDAAVVSRDMFWQQAGLWLPQTPAQPYPLRYALTDGRRHPLRPAKQHGTLYQRHIPWLGGSLSLRALDIEQDLARFNRWMNDPVVAQFWQEEGDEAKHRAYLEGIAADPHMQSLVACFEGEPFGYFETYWAKENRIAPFYDAADFDRGWHVLIGEPAFRGKPYATAWFPSIAHYLFLDDPRTQRIVGEPRSDHHRQIGNLLRSGYAHLKDFDFPHKRASLVMLLRERFFGDALWHPRPRATTPQD
ncbi:MAG: N-acetyltransferase [Rubrivivax sp.]|nr:MAG: N-acetyltransferase [Rubrivivax sp.]